MIYIDYNNFKNKFHEALNTYNDILDEQTELFSKTQPQSTDYSKINVNGGETSNTFDTYLISKEKKDIDNRLNEAKKIMQERKLLYDMKLEELKHSNNYFDKIYYNRVVENKTVTQISLLIPCDRATVYRYMGEIERTLKKEGYDVHSIYARKQRK